MIYLDNSATTRVVPEVVQAMTDVMQNIYGNPSSLHGLGVKAERLLEFSRKVIAQELRVEQREILFTSGGTEANNLAIKGVIEQYANRGRHLITTACEHPSVYEVYRYYEQQGWQVTYLPVDEKGQIRIEDLERALTPETLLVSVIHVNNETGVVQPIAEIGQVLKQYPRTFFHVDAVQSFTKIPLYPHRDQIDLLSLSGHKIHGPKGVGALYIKKNMKLAPQLIGGGQENGLRSGTYNVPGIAGLAKAVVWSKSHRKLIQEMAAWKKSFWQELSQQVNHVHLNGDLEASAPYIINLSFPGLKSEVIVHALEAEKCYVSSQSACSSKSEKPSRTLLAMGLSQEIARSSIRISLGYLSQQSDLEGLLDKLSTVIPQLQRVMRV
jgi:cysteine desulfurase